MAEETSQAPVIVDMNEPELNKQRDFPDNFIKTSKYNILTFVPLNLFYQFKKVSNFYFLVNAIVAIIPGVAPVSPATAIVPLVFVVSVAMIKDGYEDYLRHLADNRANSITAKVIRKVDGKNELIELESQDIHVGDIVKMELGDEFRADILLLSSALAEGQCFIDTCNLDGETNLKNRKAIEDTWHLNSVEAFEKASVQIQTGEPDPGLLYWTGLLIMDGKEVAVGLDQFLYRSAVMRNTDWAWGVVVYAGIDTKMFRNLQEKPPKMSNLDHKLNKLIIAVLVLQNLVLIVMCSLSVWWESKKSGHWYIDHYLREKEGITLWGYRYLTYFILMSYMIPISLFVTIELCKVAQALLMRWDLELCEWMNDKWNYCVPNTSNLNEQLSQVRFIFSDKTGTLTENIMNYVQGDIGGLPIDASKWELSRGYLADSQHHEAAKRYFKALAICHTIQPFADKHHAGHIVYEGASPDESALVKAAAQNDIVLTERTTKTMTVKVLGTEEKYEILATLEFTPDRKTMSIIVREPNGDIAMYSKGADSFVLPNLDASPNHPNASIVEPAKEALKEMAGLGLRTLVICSRNLTQNQFDDWNAKFMDAGKQLVDRSAKVDDVCRMIEKELTLVGSTAIEDKLQDQVPETLKFFLDAGVVIWMLTGDKRETAVTIAATSSLCNPMEDEIAHIDIGDMAVDSTEANALVKQQLDDITGFLESGQKKVTFVVDGVALGICMNALFDEFLDISQRVNSAVCCRLTPLQKANVVKMFQTATGSTAIAIGDGANDVSMIQEGRVGVGIIGLEGAQAALAADYAIPRFKHLRRLCCVHGRYALNRNAVCVCFSFYKNIMLAMTQFYFAFYTGFSGQTMMDGWILSFFNFSFTSLPPMFFGMFEKDLTERALMENASLLPPLAQGLYFDVPTLARWFIESIVHSLILFYVCYPTGLLSDLSHKNMDSYMFGTIVASAMVLLVLTKLAIHVRYWNVIQAAGFAFSYCFYIIFLLSYAAIPNLFGDSSFYFTTYHLMGDVKFWLLIVLFVVGLLFPIDVAIMFLQRKLKPSVRDEMQEQYSDEH